ncbi:hypothetical protein [Janthinobacterium sp. FW305-128]|uniref:hypothetical protein n=1 Tax=Janthinobacterium sp. FW305-128 TaxID=2775055 RepID=UPI001E566D52|nr:hypothetical protein [Janthinobacterium sp. FW305-128]MCC7681051.1 hypothetical protein [Janthinobacterium sp. FW305-128]
MKFITYVLLDKKVNSQNIQFVMDIGSYAELAGNIINNNPYQRNRVSKSGSIYNLLKEDILKECIIPPIVLASTSKLMPGSSPDDLLEEVLADYANLKILDGLQRTLSIIDVYNNNRAHFDGLTEKYFIRIEAYLSISDSGILYRMLTLNTGQTPMTLRHQLEILFSKYADGEFDGVKILREVDDSSVRSINDYRFSDLIDGYTSFLEKNELPIDRVDILQTVRTIKFISDEGFEKMEFSDFVNSYRALSLAFDVRFSGWSYPDDVDEDMRTAANPFGREVYKIFNKSQPLSGFGAAIAELISSGTIKGLDDIKSLVPNLEFEENDLIRINKFLDDIRGEAKKIGNGQRIFFKLFFKYLLDHDGSSFLKVSDSLERAKNRAMAEV